MKKVAKRPSERKEVQNHSFSLDSEIYNKVSCSARLMEVRLIESGYMIKPEIAAAFEDMSNLNLHYSGDCSALDFNLEAGVAVGKFDWLAEVKFGRLKCLKLRATYLLVYANLEGCDADHVRYFISKVGRFATYPYFRSHFSHNVSESQLMMPPLPTLRERVD